MARKSHQPQVDALMHEQFLHFAVLQTQERPQEAQSDRVLEIAPVDLQYKHIYIYNYIDIAYRLWLCSTADFNGP